MLSRGCFHTLTLYKRNGGFIGFDSLTVCGLNTHIQQAVRLFLLPDAFLKTYKNYTMKKVFKTTILLTAFLSILWANVQHVNIDLAKLIVVMLVSVVIAVFLVTASELYQLDKENSEDFLTPKSKKYD